MHQPQQRASRLRVVTLASALALVAAVPLAAAVAGQDARLAAEVFQAAQPRQTGNGAPGTHSSAPLSPEPGDPATSCGLEIVSPHGVAARVCVLTEGGDTWARTYYRNPTGSRLPALLTLHGPDGRTARVRCVLRGGHEGGVCETPRGGTSETSDDRAPLAAHAYSAVAEVSSVNGERLLRAGSHR
ncbi:hypothetical protein AN217_03045 [Streptomyces qinglanensis]|uniref:Secreted protein n=1 Tax=Streptomyces qinglanensis TaxID=943816 RepID=A0A1E7KEB4_9ACTN|nr:hypothetical protein AN217_03045 [Streptomyces qinglanensis]OEV27056.1 hypothetical protein AN220_06110 [Streptomyces nanshensis]